MFTWSLIVHALNLVTIVGYIFWWPDTRILYVSFFRCCQWFWRRCCRERDLQPRTIIIGRPCAEKFPANVIRNQKYNIITFLPLVCDLYYFIAWDCLIDNKNFYVWITKIRFDIKRIIFQLATFHFLLDLQYILKYIMICVSYLYYLI